MISPPFDFNVRVKMFIIIILIFSFLLAYFICLDMLLLLLLFKFSLFVCLFVFGFVFFFWFFVLQIWFVNTYRLSAISYQCPMGHRKPRGVSKGERLRLSWFLYWKKTQFLLFMILHSKLLISIELSFKIVPKSIAILYLYIVGKCRVKFWKSNQCTDERSLIYK